MLHLSQQFLFSQNFHQLHFLRQPQLSLQLSQELQQGVATGQAGDTVGQHGCAIGHAHGAAGHAHPQDGTIALEQGQAAKDA